MSATSTYDYSTSLTPALYNVGRYTYGTATNFFVGKAMTDTLDKLEIKIGANQADLGSDAELNPETYWYPSLDHNSGKFYFRPPGDMKSGFYNITATIQNPDSSMQLTTGIANTFPDNSMYSQYSSTIAGTPFSVAVLPVVTTVFPNTGSVAGGLKVEINGFGFSTSIDDMMVFVGGVPCDVESTSFDKVVCTTRPR